MLDLGGREPRGVGGDHEPADAVVGTGPDHRDPGHRAIGDPHLAPVEHPVSPAVALGVGPHRGGVGADVRFGQPEAADDLAGRHPRQPLLLLLLGAEAPDRVHGERALDGDQGADAGVGGLQLQAGQAVLDGGGTRAAVAGQGHPERAEGAQLAGEFTDAGQFAALVPVGDLRQDTLGGPAADGVPDGTVLVGQQVVEAQGVAGVEWRNRR